MKILMLAQFYPPIIGGEERHVRNLSVQLAARGHDVAVATIWHHGMPEYEEHDGVKVYRIRSVVQRAKFLFSEETRFHAPSFPDPALTQALWQIVQEHKPDVVHAHNWLIYSFLPIKRASGAKLVLTVHDHSIACPKKKLIYRDEHCDGPALRKCLSCAGEHYGPLKGAVVLGTNKIMTAAERALVDKFLLVSTAVGADNRLLNRGLPVQVLPNFVPDDVSVVSSTPHSKLAELPAEPFMLFVGAFGRYKGVDALAQAYEGLRNPPPLVLIGYSTPEYPVQTEKFAPGIHVLRDWPHGAVMQAWQRCLFGIVPSVWSDPCPTTAMEGMALSKAIVASRIGGLTDLVDDGHTGLLVKHGDVPALRAAMQLLIDQPDLRARMGQAGLQKVKHFQASAVINDIEHVYATLARGNSTVEFAT